jgi:hypothetical protein
MDRLLSLLNNAGITNYILTDGRDEGCGRKLKIIVSDDSYISVAHGANLYYSGKDTVEACVIHKGCMDYSFTGGGVLEYVHPERVVFLALNLK